MRNTMDLDQLPLGRRLRLLRVAAGLTLWEVGQRARVQPGRISELERGQRHDPKLAEKVLAALGEG